MVEGNTIQRLMGHLKWRRHIYVPTTMTLPPLDPVQVRDELALDRRAQERGERNEPAADSTIFDDVESEIIALVARQREIAGHYFHDNLSTYAQRLNSLDLDSAATDIGVESRRVVSEFQTELSHGADLVYAARQAVVERERHLRTFRKQAGLDRPADYPSAHILHIGVLLALLAVEATLNGFFLGETHILGLLGGFTEAIVIAIANVGAGATAGYGLLRQCWHRALWRKLLGILGLALYFVAVLGFNLAVAHYRDALTSGDWDTATTTALQTLSATPIGVTDIKSWLLFFIGISFSLIAMFDGFRMDDPYPGYGSRSRRLDRVREHYRLMKESCLENLSAIKDDSVDAMMSVKKEISKARGEFGSILEARQRLVEQYKGHLRGLEEVANTLLASYRNTNRSHRTTPAPKRFDERWKMEMPSVPVFGGLDQRPLDTSVHRANEVLEEQIEKVHSEYDRAVRAFQRIEELNEEEIARGSAQAIIEAA